jgi:hypothetical protein
MRLSEEMAKHWFALPLQLRKRWWDETEYGKREPSEELALAIQEAIQKKEAAR